MSYSRKRDPDTRKPDGRIQISPKELYKLGLLTKEQRIDLTAKRAKKKATPSANAAEERQNAPAPEPVVAAPKKKAKAKRGQKKRGAVSQPELNEMNTDTDKLLVLDPVAEPEQKKPHTDVHSSDANAAAETMLALTVPVTNPEMQPHPIDSEETPPAEILKPTLLAETTTATMSVERINVEKTNASMDVESINVETIKAFKSVKYYQVTLFTPPSPLHVAVAKKQYADVEKLLKDPEFRKHHLDQFDNSNRSPLLIAIGLENPRLVKLLVDAGANIYKGLWKDNIDVKSPLEQVKFVNCDSPKRTEMAAIILRIYCGNDPALQKIHEELWSRPATSLPPPLPFNL